MDIGDLIIVSSFTLESIASSIGGPDCDQGAIQGWAIQAGWLMNIGKIVLHVALLCGITALLALCIVYPFLPGEYDSLAMTLSTMVQAFGLVGLLLVPVGSLWLLYNLWRMRRRRQNLPVKGRGYVFALVTVVVATLVAAAVSLTAFLSGGPSFGFVTFALWLYVVSRLLPRMKHTRSKLRGIVRLIHSFAASCGEFDPPWIKAVENCRASDLQSRTALSDRHACRGTAFSVSCRRSLYRVQ
jgi:hypothetical protein